VGDEWTCSVCGERHEGIPLSWGFDEPIYWGWLDDASRLEGFCDANVCWYRVDDEPSYFVRGTIDIPIVGAEDTDDDSFVIGVWVSLSEQNMQWYLDNWTAEPDEQEKPWFGWLSNRIPVYEDTLNLKTNVYVRGSNQRPLIDVEPGSHQLARDQHDGITRERAYALAARWLHV